MGWKFLVWLDLTFGRSFKVKRWFIGFGELSFRWIQICIGSPMCISRFFTRQPLLFSPMVSGWAVGKVCPGYISETVSYSMLFP